MHRLASTLGSLAIVTLVSAPALAQCPNGALLCAQAGTQVIPGISANGQITVGLPPIAVPVPQQVPTVQPVQPEYPYAPAPPQYYYGPQPRPMHIHRAPSYPASPLALDLRLDGAASFAPSASKSTYGMGGAGLGLRYHPHGSHLAVEGGIDFLGGNDYYDRRSMAVVGSAGGLLYVNPRSRVQFYLDAGGMIDYTHASGPDNTLGATERGGTTSVATGAAYSHLGGYAGLGLEMFATRHIAFHLDAKGIVRGKVGGTTDGPEFVEPGTGRTTSLSGGVVGSAGMLFYF